MSDNRTTRVALRGARPVTCGWTNGGEFYVASGESVGFGAIVMDMNQAVAMISVIIKRAKEHGLIANEDAPMSSVLLDNLHNELASERRERTALEGQLEKQSRAAVILANENNNLLTNIKTLKEEIVSRNVEAMKTRAVEAMKTRIAKLEREIEQLRPVPVTPEEIAEITGESLSEEAAF